MTTKPLTAPQIKTLKEISQGFYVSYYSTSGIHHNYSTRLEKLINMGFVSQTPLYGNSTGAITGYKYALTESGRAEYEKTIPPPATFFKAAPPAPPVANTAARDLLDTLNAGEGATFMVFQLGGYNPFTDEISLNKPVAVSADFDRAVTAAAAHVEMKSDDLNWIACQMSGGNWLFAKGVAAYPVVITVMIGV